MTPKITEIKNPKELQGKFDLSNDNALFNEILRKEKCPPVEEISVDLPLKLFQKYINYDLLVEKGLQELLRKVTIGKFDAIPAMEEHINDRKALIAIHKAAYGNEWHYKWNLDTPFSEWHGVKTELKRIMVILSNGKRYLTRVQRVVELDLSYNKLGKQVGNKETGFLSPQVGKLTALRKLYVNNNDLHGAIPGTIGYLKNLTDLRLQKNHFRGAIPSALGNLTKLTRLQLDHNRLEGVIPGSLGKLTQLDTLCLHNNLLDSQCGKHIIHNIPAEIASIPQLKEFRVYGNQLFGPIPDALCKHPLFNLWDLNPQQNFFGFDKNLCNITNPQTIKQMKTLLLSGANLVSGDPTLKIVYPHISHAATHITSSQPGDFKWVEIPLPLCAGDVIKQVKITYRVQGTKSYLSQIRLAEYEDSDRALVKHDDGTDHRSTKSAVAVSNSDVKVNNSMMLSLRLFFGSVSDEIIISSVAITYR